MHTFSGRAKNDRLIPLLLTGIVLGIVLTHFLILSWRPHPALVSNVIQLFPVLVLILAILRQRHASANQLARQRWTALAAAFAVWWIGQVFFLYYLLYPDRVPRLVRPDDVLWLIFNLPLLLATVMTTEKVDRVGWLDRLQVGVSFIVLYLLVFLPSIHLNIDIVYGIQDVAVVLCCISRISVSRDAGERRFFLRLVLFFVFTGSASLPAASSAQGTFHPAASWIWCGHCRSWRSPF